MINWKTAFCFNLNCKISCHVLSRTFDMSKTLLGYAVLNLRKCPCVLAGNCQVQKSLRQKAEKYFFLKFLKSSLNMSISKILMHIDVSYIKIKFSHQLHLTILFLMSLGYWLSSTCIGLKLHIIITLKRIISESFIGSNYIKSMYEIVGLKYCNFNKLMSSNTIELSVTKGKRV